MSSIWILGPAALSGLVQSTTGFGAGIVLMLFLPYFFPIQQCPVVTSLVCYVGIAASAITYRKHIQWNLIWKPLIIYTAASTVSIRLAVGLDTGKLTAAFGVFLVALSIYLIFFAGNIKIKPNLLSVILCSSLAGIANGFFGISGPPVALYFLSVTNGDKKQYIGTSQMFFALSAVYTTAVRFMSGLVTKEILGYILPGMIGVLIGQQLGRLVINHIHTETLKKTVYVMLAFSGIISFLQNV